MKDKTILYLILVFFFVGILIASLGVPMLYWFKHPELTEMQMLFEFWDYYIVFFIAIVGFEIVNSKLRKIK